MVVKRTESNSFSKSASFFGPKKFRVIFLLIYILITVQAFGAATVSNVTVSPGTVSAGGKITVDFDFVCNDGGGDMSWSVAIRPNDDGTTLNQAWGGTTDQDFFVDSGTIDNICEDCGGGPHSKVTSVTTGSTQEISDYETVELTIPADYTEQTYSLIVLVRDSSGGIYVNSFDDEDYTTFDVSSSPIEAEKSAEPTTACEGDTITFCITATNTGSSAYTFDIWDTVPDGLTYVDCDNSCSQSGGVVSWTVTSLAASSSVTRCFWATVDEITYYEFNKIIFACRKSRSEIQMKDFSEINNCQDCIIK